jgi:hypothetical protein
MIFNTKNESDKSKAREYLEKLINKNCVFELKERRKKRTNNQNRYLHLILGFFGHEHGYTLEETKQFYKLVCKSIYYYEKNNVNFIKSSKELDTKEMKNSIDMFRDYCSMNLNFYIPSPDEHDFLLQIEQQIKDNNFLNI